MTQNLDIGEVPQAVLLAVARPFLGNRQSRQQHRRVAGGAVLSHQLVEDQVLGAARQVVE